MTSKETNTENISLPSEVLLNVTEAFTFFFLMRCLHWVCTKIFENPLG